MISPQFRFIISAREYPHISQSLSLTSNQFRLTGSDMAISDEAALEQAAVQGLPLRQFAFRPFPAPHAVQKPRDDAGFDDNGQGQQNDQRRAPWTVGHPPN